MKNLECRTVEWKSSSVFGTRPFLSRTMTSCATWGAVLRIHFDVGFESSDFFASYHRLLTFVVTRTMESYPRREDKVWAYQLELRWSPKAQPARFSSLSFDIPPASLLALLPATATLRLLHRAVAAGITRWKTRFALHTFGNKQIFLNTLLNYL